MGMTQRHWSKTFQRFVDSEQASGILLIPCTVSSLLIANSSIGTSYLNWWHTWAGGLSLEHWINDALMAVFFLLIGLELERELHSGELSDFRNALLPVFAAVGGIVTPALIHFSLNAGTPTQTGIGIPMATDIAFALGILAILGNRIPASLKILVVAFSVIDDLGAIIIIAVFYTAQVSVGYLAAALAIWALLCALNRFLRVMSLTPYLLGGALMWLFMLKSGVHATIAGVMLAFAIPFTAKDEDTGSPSHRLEHLLHKPVAFLILPIFVLANTAIPVGADWTKHLASTNTLGITAGLVMGKPLGVTLTCFAAVASGICRLPPDLTWRHMVGAGMLGGIGFTMSIFIANLAFAGNDETITASKMAVLLASLAAGSVGFLWLMVLGKPDAKPGMTPGRAQ
jgi:NhaA family Na+:H+ antiporter